MAPGESPVHDALILLIPRLRRYARMLCADSQGADDLVQDTLERACARLAQWRPDTDLRAWAFTIMHNLFVSETRRPWHRFEMPLADDEPQPGAAPRAAAAGRGARVHDAADPSVGWIAALDLERALQALPDAQRQVLVLVAFEDLSYEQVASVLGVPIGTVMSRLSRARAGLRARLEVADGAAPPRPGPDLRILK